MTWFDIVKQFDWRKNRDARIMRPAGEPSGDAPTEELEDIKFRNVGGSGKIQVSAMGFKAARDNYTAFKKANIKSHYENVANILEKYSKTRTVQPQRNLMEEYMADYWEDSLVSLRNLYANIEKIAKEVDDKFKDEPEYLTGKDSAYVLQQANKMRQEDEAAL
tara:strand:+ start:11846 stop:12334 length:489 start_codon:yes stop_codon:yes gene_type:complete